MGPSVGKYTTTTHHAAVSYPNLLPAVMPPCSLYCCFPGFFIFSVLWLRVLLFVQVFKIKSACNLRHLGRIVICKFLFLLLYSLFFASPHLVIYMCVCIYTYIQTHTHAHVCMCGCMHTQRQIPPVIFNIPDFKNWEWDELVSAVHCFKLTVVAFILPNCSTLF